MANQATGLNPARQGQFVKGNKTKFEYADVMSNANGRDMTVSLMLEGGFFTPVKKMLLTNILQYQGRAVVPNPMTGEVVAVDPVALSKATIVMKVTDGLTPSDKIIDGDTLTQAVQLLMSDQGAISSEFNMGDMVSYLFSSRGAKLGTFKKSPQQVAYEQAVGQWQQTLQMIAEQFAGGQATPEQVQQMLQSVPQPTPEQFGYVPGTKKLTAGAATSNSPSILGTITQTIQAAQTAEQGANNATPAE